MKCSQSPGSFKAKFREGSLKTGVRRCGSSIGKRNGDNFPQSGALDPPSICAPIRLTSCLQNKFVHTNGAVDHSSSEFRRDKKVA